jgi:hypothetical protein
MYETDEGDSTAVVSERLDTSIQGRRFGRRIAHETVWEAMSIREREPLLACCLRLL